MFHVCKRWNRHSTSQTVLRVHTAPDHQLLFVLNILNASFALNGLACIIDAPEVALHWVNNVGHATMQLGNLNWISVFSNVHSESPICCGRKMHWHHHTVKLLGQKLQERWQEDLSILDVNLQIEKKQLELGPSLKACETAILAR